MLTLMRLLVATVFSLLIASAALAEQQVDTNADGVALQGHDPVAYFSADKAMAGSSEFSAQHNGATYYFANAENQATFTANPDKYAPQYGGFCAFGTTFSKKVPGDPQAFKVVDGLLYINSSADILSRWSQDISGNITKANSTWSQIKDKDPAAL